MAFVAVGVLAIGNLGIVVSIRRAKDLNAIQRVALASVVIDGLACTLLVYAYTFDTETAVWAILYIVPLSGVALFQMRGALWTMAVLAVLYTIREVYGHVAFGNEFLPVSITFRMGVGFVIAAFAGAMAWNLVSRLGELRVLNRITQTVAEARDLRLALDAVGPELVSALGARTAAIALTDQDRRSISVMADHVAPGMDAPSLQGRRFALEASPLLEEVLQTGRATAVSDDDPRLGEEVSASMVERGARGLLIVPLQVRGEPLGAIALDTEQPGRTFTPAEISLAETIAGQIAGALENARLFDEMFEYVEQVGQVVNAAAAVETRTFRAESLDEVGRRDDALGQLARVFQRMARQVAVREERLRQEVRQLRIEIDEVRAARNVEEITESDRFQRLREKGALLRRRPRVPDQGGGGSP